MKHALPALALSILAAVAAAQGIDRLVDASGSSSVYTNITQAMLASAPGDRILVLPGTYPGFQFTHGVKVIGLGSDPSQVVVARIAYHVSVPNIGYDTLISNLTVESTDPLDTLALHGNELAPGVLVLDGVHLRGGVFLRGGQAGFYCLMSNCLIDPPAGDGFSGEACRIGGPGNWFEIRNSRLRGADADAAALIPASVGLRVAGGTQLRVSHTMVSGGSGVASPGLMDGAAAIVSAPSGPAAVRLDGGSIVTGGAGAASGAGGIGVAVFGTVETRDATVTGGAGIPAGAPFAHATVTPLPVDVHLRVTPALTDAQGPVAVVSGQTLTFSVASGGAPTAMGINIGVQLPQGGAFVPLVTDNALIVVNDTFSVVVPTLPGLNWTGLMIYAEAAVVDPTSGALLYSDTATVRVDIL